MLKLDFEEIIQECPDPIIGTNREGVITLYNESAENLLGYKANEVLDKLSIQHIYTDKFDLREIKRLIHSPYCSEPGKIKDFEAELRTADNQVVPVRLSANLIMKDNVEVGCIGFFHDLKSQKMLEAELRHLSITDGLTGLYNQRHFYAELDREMIRSKRYHNPLVLLCIDLDSLKRVNDTFGHRVGDQVICKLGGLLKQSLRASDSAYRYGGDEFMVMLPDTRLEAAILVAERIRRSFNWCIEYNGNISGETEGYDVKATLSIGLALHKVNEGLNQFVQRADFSMYDAKKSGGNSLRTFETSTPSSCTISLQANSVVPEV